MSKLKLFPHNEEAYNKVKKAFETSNVVGIVHATGTGKTYNALALCLDNLDKKVVYVVPSNGIIEHVQSEIQKNGLADELKNITFITYQSLINQSYEELQNLDVDLLILDEFHHIGAPVWGVRINTIIDTHPDLKIFGMTAYTIRDRSSEYERDMAEDGGNELFSDKIVSRYDLVDAMLDKVIGMPIYRMGYAKLIGLERLLEERLLNGRYTFAEKERYLNILKSLKKRLEQANNNQEIVRQYVAPGSKVIYFCPLGVDIDLIIDEVKMWFKGYIAPDDIEIYKTTADMGMLGAKNRDAFYNDCDLDGHDVSGKLRIMFTINQYNEGIHAPNVDTIIMSRETKSDIIFFEQLGRALTSKANSKKEFYEGLSIEELFSLCKEKHLNVKPDFSKEKLIELLCSPLILDLAGNIDFVMSLENELKNRIKIRYPNNESNNISDTFFEDALFDIEMFDIDMLQALLTIKDRLSRNWEDYYNLASIYYEHHGDLFIPSGFRTINGYEYNSMGYALASWVNNQRTLAKNGKLLEYRKQLLDKIGMVYDVLDYRWNLMYELAKKYKEHYKDLEIVSTFKTKDGVNYAEDGYNLGGWVSNQRQAKRKGTLSKEYEDKLSAIGFRFENKHLSWDAMYELARKYYEHHRNLAVSYDFKTKDGFTYVEDGYNLGIWLSTQKTAKRDGTLTSDKEKKLVEIGIVFDLLDKQWLERFELLKKYYKHYGNLNLTYAFKTKNGYEYDENGYNLLTWINRQLQRIENGTLSEERVQMLNKLLGEANWKKYKKDVWWDEMYALAQKFYECHKNLKLPYHFKTSDGLNYDENGKDLYEWIMTQRIAKQEGKLSEEREEKLNKIGMVYNVYDFRYQMTYDLAKIYYGHYGNLLVPVTFKTSNGYEYDANGIALGTWVRNLRKREEKLDWDKKKDLLAIGMVFDLRKNKEKKQEICQNYGIDIEINKNTIRVISVIELEVKIKFLMDNNIPITENGILNEIFSMSSEALEEKYGLSLVNLIDRYYGVTR